MPLAALTTDLPHPMFLIWRPSDHAILSIVITSVWQAEVRNLLGDEAVMAN